jgi:hypothetical protein
VTPGFGPAAGALVAVLVGCSNAPTAPSPAAVSPSPAVTASPSPASGGVVVPPKAAWLFGAVEAVRMPTEKAIQFQRGIDPASKNYGSGQSYYVRIGAREYPVHYRHAKVVQALKVGDTVNLHPSGWIMCVEADDGTKSCAELFNLFKSRRAQPPIGGV